MSCIPIIIDYSLFSNGNTFTCKSSAPGEARTHNLRMAHSSPNTDYKYGALTDCATGALSIFGRKVYILLIIIIKVYIYIYNKFASEFSTYGIV